MIHEVNSAVGFSIVMYKGFSSILGDKIYTTAVFSLFIRLNDDQGRITE